MRRREEGEASFGVPFWRSLRAATEERVAKGRIGFEFDFLSLSFRFAEFPIFYIFFMAFEKAMDC